MKFLKSKLTLVAVAVFICGLVVTGVWRGTVVQPARAANASSSSNKHIGCSKGAPLCTEVWDSEKVFGEDVYVGHDEPSTLFYSNQPGSGNRMRYNLTLPKDPPISPLVRGKAFNFQIRVAFWFGMAMCDTESYPELLNNCTPDSDVNIVDPAISPKHPGTAFMEMQFYPPGWAPWPAGASCSARQWCAALNIDSLSLNPVTGQALNSTCASQLLFPGIEYVNFAFITKSGKPHGPANPINMNINTITPNPNTDLFMNSGDNLVLTMHDTAHGLQVVIDDLSTGQSGSMTASAANSFGQIKFAPTGTTCQNIPYDFHPMYSTSSEKTRVPWAAHSYNIAWSDEIGHFDYCEGSHPITPGGNCPRYNHEGTGVDREPSDADDTYCFPASFSTLVKVSGCQGSNTGFDGTSYQPVWPDGNTNLHPTPIKFRGF